MNYDSYKVKMLSVIPWVTTKKKKKKLKIPQRNEKLEKLYTRKKK